MFCPICNTQNLATSIRCSQCGTTLIHEAEGHSKEYKVVARAIDRRIYGGVGAFLGLCISVFLLNTFLENFFFDQRVVCVSGVAAGGICGRVVAWLKWRHA